MAGIAWEYGNRFLWCSGTLAVNIIASAFSYRLIEVRGRDLIRGKTSGWFNSKQNESVLEAVDKKTAA